MDYNDKDFAHIKGWGMDANPDDEPNYPMKHWTGDDHRRLDYERGPQQPVDVEILRSNERPGNTTVFGNTLPPSGISGAIRRWAFTHSESSYAHWLPLLFADRVNMVEGLVDDLRRGYFPNIIAEKGWTAEWKYNRKSLVKKLVVGALLTTAALVILTRKKRSRHPSKTAR